MKTAVVTVVAVVACTGLLMSGVAAHAQSAPASAPAFGASSTGTVQRVEGAVVRGAQAAASGIERGVGAAKRGVQIGVEAAASGMQRGAKAVSDVGDKVARKVGGGASAPGQ